MVEADSKCSVGFVCGISPCWVPAGLLQRLFFCEKEQEDLTIVQRQLGSQLLIEYPRTVVFGKSASKRIKIEIVNKSNKPFYYFPGYVTSFAAKIEVGLYDSNQTVVSLRTHFDHFVLISMRNLRVLNPGERLTRVLDLDGLYVPLKPGKYSFRLICSRPKDSDQVTEFGCSELVADIKLTTIIIK